MSGYDYSVTLIIPDALRDDANRLACAMGWDASPLPGRTFSIPLAATEDGSVSHWLCRFNARPSWLAEWKEARANGLKAPPAGGEWADYGLTGPKIAAVVQGVEIDARTFNDDRAQVEKIAKLAMDGGAAHWKVVVAAKGLAVIVDLA